VSTLDDQAAAQPAAEVDFVLDDGSDTPVEAASLPGPPPAPQPQAPAGDDVFGEATFVGKRIETPPAAHGGPAAATAQDDAVFGEATFVGKALPVQSPGEPSVEDSVFLEVTQMRRHLPPPEELLAQLQPAKEESPAAPEEPGSASAPQAPEAAASPSVHEADVTREVPSLFLEQTLPPAAVPQAQPPAVPADAIAAFLEGAGLPARQFAGPAEAEQFLRQCGAIVRAAVDGVMVLLAARAEAKKEFRAEDRTMVASRDNNPLKLMADPQEAMEFLFDTRERAGGFLTPVQAVGDAFEDMRAHEAALIAGMRAAILGALRRFDPKTLEEDLGKAAGGLGLNRRAKLWELFSAHQQKLARDAEDDFNKVFGRDFVAAYMAQVRQLKKK
jgi:type VI secretion system FHA domain protein